MKKYLLLSILFMSIATYAQKGEMAAGINLGYGVGMKSLELGAKFQYGISDAIRAELSGDYFLKKDGMSMFDINLNAHYLIPVASKFKVYPLLGLTFAHYKTDSSWGDDEEYEGYDYFNVKTRSYDDEDYDDYEGSPSGDSNRFGMNIGVGTSYDITNNIILNFEFRYQLVKDFDQGIFSIGAAYRF